jgi:hypothetical protein
MLRKSAVSASALAMIDLSCMVLSLRMIALGKMNRRDMLGLRELIERIDRLLKEYLRASNPDQLAILEAEITAATEKLKRTAASLID